MWKQQTEQKGGFLQNDHWNLQNDQLHHCSAAGDVGSCPQPQAGNFLSIPKKNCSFPP